jgi:dipicolinate synthase subunit B
MIGYAFCGSFCTLSASLDALGKLIDAGVDILPIFSERVAETNTRFWKAKEFTQTVETLCGKKGIYTIVEAEPLGPRVHLDALVIAPCTGNTLAKIANGITDGVVPMAAKAHIRSDRPLLLALASNDAMSATLPSLAHLLEKKHVYFVPLRQDDPEKKPHSLVADFSRVPECLTSALHGKQVRPLFL